MANFDAFIIDRGHAVMILGVPTQFSGLKRPDYVGVLARQAALMSDEERRKCQRNGREQCRYKRIGKRGGGIFKVKNASRLHTTAGG